MKSLKCLKMSFVRPPYNPYQMGQRLNCTAATDTTQSATRTIPITGIQTCMKAWQIENYGGLNALHCNDNVPVPGIRNPTDVLVEVCAASVNPLDVAMTTGYGSNVFNRLRILGQRTLFPTEFPLTLGRDFSGVVRETGFMAGNIEIGDEVVGVVGIQQQGSHAQYVVASSCLMAKKPANLNHVEAASLTYAGLTAWSALRCFGGIRPRTVKGQRVLILGGSGGVGTIAIQLLKAWGMHVTTVVHADAVPLVTSLGTDLVIDYSQPEWENSLREHQRYDVVLNCTTSLSSTFAMDLMKQWNNAKYVHMQGPLLRNINAYGWPIGLLNSTMELCYDNFKGFTHGGIVYRWAYALPSKRGLEKIMEMAHNGELQPVVEKVFTLEQTPQAYEKLKAGHARGKTVINLKEPTTFASPVNN